MYIFLTGEHLTSRSLSEAKVFKYKSIWHKFINRLVNQISAIVDDEAVVGIDEKDSYGVFNMYLVKLCI